VLSPDLVSHIHNSLICLPDTERALQYIGDRRRRCLPITAEEPAAPTRKTYAGISNDMPILCNLSVRSANSALKGNQLVWRRGRHHLVHDDAGIRWGDKGPHPNRFWHGPNLTL
jgi:hypothetical protein